MIETNRKAFGQIMFCKGCCCGREDRGYPPVPVERIKARWKERKLNRGIQLTISGCLGPCDAANVALIISEDRQLWLGQLKDDHEYEALMDWAEACAENRTMLALPEFLRSREMSRWPALAVKDTST